jgi:hypothetical protein
VRRKRSSSKTPQLLRLKQENFRQELKRQRDEIIERALDILKVNISKATETLVKLLDSDKEGIQARAAEDIVEFAQNALEYECGHMLSAAGHSPAKRLTSSEKNTPKSDGVPGDA